MYFAVFFPLHKAIKPSEYRLKLQMQFIPYEKRLIFKAHKSEKYSVYAHETTAKTKLGS